MYAYLFIYFYLLIWKIHTTNYTTTQNNRANYKKLLTVNQVNMLDTNKLSQVNKLHWKLNEQ